MIKVNVTKDTMIITGHAGFAEYGKDIVCASVSSMVTSSVNDMFTVNPKAITYKDDGNVMTIKITLDDDLVIKLFNNLKELLINLSKDYPKNINVKEE
jgi:uncharacterized protein